MIRVRLQIDDGPILDTMDEYGLVYISSDHRFEAPIKEFDKTSYPEQEGENIVAKSVSDAFDYKITWFVKADGKLGNANRIIGRFNSRLYTRINDIKSFHQVTFYNDYKKVKIVGTPSPIQEATDFWRDANGKQHDVVCVEWTIRVTKPSLCDFYII